MGTKRLPPLVPAAAAGATLIRPRHLDAEKNHCEWVGHVRRRTHGSTSNAMWRIDNPGFKSALRLLGSLFTLALSPSSGRWWLSSERKNAIRVHNDYKDHLLGPSSVSADSLSGLACCRASGNPRGREPVRCAGPCVTCAETRARTLAE